MITRLFSESAYFCQGQNINQNVIWDVNPDFRINPDSDRMSAFFFINTNQLLCSRPVGRRIMRCTPFVRLSVRVSRAHRSKLQSQRSRSLVTERGGCTAHRVGHRACTAYFLSVCGAVLFIHLLLFVSDLKRLF